MRKSRAVDAGPPRLPLRNDLRPLVRLRPRFWFVASWGCSLARSAGCTARGELDRAREIETDLHDELERIRARIDADRPESVELDAETEAARHARDPLGPATRQAPERTADIDDVEAVKRLIDPTRRRRPRQR
jgi:hypothetical protein